MKTCISKILLYFIKIILILMFSHFYFIYNVINKLKFNCTVSYNKRILYMWINLDTIFIIIYYI